MTMNTFGFMVQKFRGSNWIMETPYKSVEAMADDIITCQIDDPREIANMFWIEDGKCEEVTQRVAQLVWNHYDATTDHLFRETDRWLTDLGLYTDHMCGDDRV